MRLLFAVTMVGMMMSRSVVADDALQKVRFEFGTTLNVVLSDTLDSRKNKVGDAVKAKTSEDVRAGGLVVIPRGSKLVGHVTEARTATNKDEQARLGVVFDRAELKGGSQVALQTSFYALAAPEGAVSDRGLSPGGGFGGGLGSGSVGVGDMASSSSSADDLSATGRGRSKTEDLKPSPGAIGGLNSTGTLYASSRGVFGLEQVSLEPNTVPSSGSAVVLADSRNVHLSSGTRMLLAVEAGR